MFTYGGSLVRVPIRGIWAVPPNDGAEPCLGARAGKPSWRPSLPSQRRNVLRCSTFTAHRSHGVTSSACAAHLPVPHSPRLFVPRGTFHHSSPPWRPLHSHVRNIFPLIIRLASPIIRVYGTYFHIYFSCRPFIRRSSWRPILRMYGTSSHTSFSWRPIIHMYGTSYRSSSSRLSVPRMYGTFYRSLPSRRPHYSHVRNFFPFIILPPPRCPSGKMLFTAYPPPPLVRMPPESKEKAAPRTDSVLGTAANRTWRIRGALPVLFSCLRSRACRAGRTCSPCRLRRRADRTD